MSKSTSTGFSHRSSGISAASTARTGEGRAERSHPGPVPAADTSASPPRSDDPAETDLGKDMNTRREAKDKSAKGKKERRQRVRDEKEQVKFIKDKREATMRAAGQEFFEGLPYANVDTTRERGMNMIDKMVKAITDWPFPEKAAEDDKDEPHLTDGAPAEHQRQ